MGEELLNDSPKLTYEEQFNQAIPYYLSIGMTYDQFWREDASLVASYREADKLRIDRENTMIWLHGMYIYDALCDVSPTLHAFAKKGTKPHPYPDKPYDIKSTKRESDIEESERKQFEKNKAHIVAWMTGTNEQFKRREADQKL